MQIGDQHPAAGNVRLRGDSLFRIIISRVSPTVRPRLAGAGAATPTFRGTEAS
jgi:hypothetical protein